MPIEADKNSYMTEENGVTKFKSQKALIFVKENTRAINKDKYSARVLIGTRGIMDEVDNVGSDSSEDIVGLEAHFPRRQGLHVWEGDLIFDLGEEEPPTWHGQYRSMNPGDFELFDI